VAVGEVLAFPGKRALLVGERLGDQVDRLPVPLKVVDRADICRGMFGATRFDKAEFEPTARDDIGRRILLGDAHRFEAQRNERTEA
jgi:hypothetical protein